MSSAKTKHPLYNTWYAMVSRCHRTESPDYRNYGQRGITVCDAWRNDFWTYAAYIESELGPKPSADMTLDRIDNDHGYHPGNLRWATRAQQVANRRAVAAGQRGPEFIEKMRLLGLEPAAQARASKMGKDNIGKIRSSETKAKISAAKQGTEFSEEHKAQLSLAAKERWARYRNEKRTNQ